MRLVNTAIAGLILVTAQFAVTAPPCSETDALTTGCSNVSGTLTDDSAVLNGSQPGGPGSGSNGSGGNGNSNNGAAAPPAQPPPCNGSGCVDRGTFVVTTLPVPTLTDIAAFRPAPGVDHMEPDGWFVVGLDANFYATGGASVVSGTLLGYPAQVRFTPIRWRWTYGDGTTATRSTPGAPWAAQGIPEFEQTSTSHVYSLPGTYYIDLTIGYRAEYSFNGSSWATIVGTLWLPANRLVATVGSAKTVLVERDCTLAPVGPGCAN